MHVHLLELLPSNRELLRWLINFTRLSDVAFVHDYAISNATYLAPEPAGKAGYEQLSLKDGDGADLVRARRGQNTSTIQVLTLDEFMLRQRLDEVWAVVIDAEGYDALVLEGMRRVLVGCLERIELFSSNSSIIALAIGDPRSPFRKDAASRLHSNGSERSATHALWRPGTLLHPSLGRAGWMRSRRNNGATSSAPTERSCYTTCQSRATSSVRRELGEHLSGQARTRPEAVATRKD